MPDSAIASGVVDFAVAVEGMAAKLEENARNLRDSGRLAEKTGASAARPTTKRRRRFTRCCAPRPAMISAATRPGPFCVGSRRRMQTHHCETMADYVGVLERQPEEATALFRDLLINVTSFFRDPDAFEALRTQVIPRLFEGRGAADTVRVWSPAAPRARK